MVHAPDLPPTSVARGGLEHDLFCASCGYNLRGLAPDGKCPECGTPVSRSIYGIYLRYCDAAWVEKLRRGGSLLRWSIVLSILLAVSAGLVGGLFGARGGPPPPAFGIAAFLIQAAVQVMGLMAAFLVTTQEPRIALTEDPITLRKVVRVCALAGFTGFLFGNVSEFGSGRTKVVLLLVGSVLSLAAIGGFFGLFVCFRRFALRLPDGALARSTRTVMWGFVISYSLILVGVVVGAVSGAMAAGRGGGAAGALPTMRIPGVAVVVSAALVVLVFICWAYRLLLRYNRAFAEASRLAREFARRGPVDDPVGSLGSAAVARGTIPP